MAATTPPPQPWERQPNESDPAWEAFVTYRDLGLDRSAAKVAKALGKSTTLMDRWSSRNSWVLRARAWDSEEDRLHRQTMVRARRDAEQRNLKVAGAMMGQAVSGLQSITSLKPGDIARFVEVAAKIEQLTLGGPTARVDVTGVGGGANAHLDLSQLTDEERLSRMLLLRRELEGRIERLQGSADEVAS